MSKVPALAWINALCLAFANVPAIAAPNAGGGPGVCSGDQMSRVFKNFPRPSEICLVQGRAIFCTADGNWQCCKPDGTGCSASHPIGRVSVAPGVAGGLAPVGPNPNGAPTIPMPAPRTPTSGAKNSGVLPN
jgi:hypothetical protein